jgi:glutamine cyclotransferase
MSEEKQKETQMVVINDVEYDPKDFTEQQVALVNHVADLDRKIGGSMFNLDQLQGGREFFMKKLEAELESDEEVTVVESD